MVLVILAFTSKLELNIRNACAGIARSKSEFIITSRADVKAKRYRGRNDRWFGVWRTSKDNSRPPTLLRTVVNGMSPEGCEDSGRYLDLFSIRNALGILPKKIKGKRLNTDQGSFYSLQWPRYKRRTRCRFRSSSVAEIGGPYSKSQGRPCHQRGRY